MSLPFKLKEEHLNSFVDALYVPLPWHTQPTPVVRAPLQTRDPYLENLFEYLGDTACPMRYYAYYVLQDAAPGPLPVIDGDIKANVITDLCIGKKDGSLEKAIVRELARIGKQDPNYGGFVQFVYQDMLESQSKNLATQSVSEAVLMYVLFERQYARIALRSN